MKAFTKISTLLFGLLFSLSAFAQTRIQIQPSSHSTNKISQDDLYEMQTLGYDIPDDAPEKAGIFADPNAMRTMACPTAYNLICPYNTNNGQRGCMFDILATNTVTISCFESSLYAGTTANYEIHYRPSTHVGFQNSAAGWTLLGTASGITSAGNNLPTPLPIPIGVTIPAGQRYSFYITNDFGGGTSYTDGTAVGNFLAGDANMTTYEGVGKSYPFGLTFTVRNFNGTIYYDLGGVFDANEATIAAEMKHERVNLTWNVSEIENFQKVDLEYAKGDGKFETVKSISKDSDTGQMEIAANSTENWYRLRLSSQNGDQKFSNIAKVSLEASQAFKILGLAPNPSQNDVRLRFENQSEKAVFVTLVDAIGREVYSASFAEGLHDFMLPMESLEAGIYMLQLKGNGQRETRRLVRL